MSESILSPTTPSSGLTSPPADNTKNSSVLELEQQQATSSPPSTSLLSPPPAQADPPIVQGPPSLTSTPPPTSTPAVTPPPFRPPPSPPPPQQPTNPPPPPPSALSPPPSPSSGSNAPPPTQATPVVNSPPPPTTPTTIPSSPPPSTQITPPLSPPSNPSAPPTITSPSPATPSKSSATPSVSPPARRSPHLTTTKNSGSRPSSSSAASASASSSQSSYATATVVAITVAAGVLIAFVAIFFVVTWRKRKKRMNGHEGQYKLPNDVLPNTNFGLKPAASPRGENSFRSRGGQFSYEELMSITSGFSRENQIGEGGFGPVYRGVLPDGKQVAVKQLKLGSGQGEREFRSEVEIISRVHHRHLVSLVGYCVAEHHRLLVYEFVSNKTLEHHLHGQGLPVLDWPKRMKIAIGSARGLAYLHEDCHPRIIHRDIKSANILLDDSFEAQVADFGLAKLSNDTHTHVSTRVMGTFGYLAPEYASSGKLTDRSDVYSFGVVLLELITGRKPIDSSQPLGDESLVEWARPRLIHALDTGDYIEVVDPKLENNFHKNDMLRVIEAAAACVRHSAPKRPRMVQVLRALDSDGSLPDLSNGVKFGQSTIFDSGQYSADIQKFHRLAFDSDIYSMDCDNSGER